MEETWELRTGTRSVNIWLVIIVKQTEPHIWGRNTVFTTNAKSLNSTVLFLLKLFIQVNLRLAKTILTDHDVRFNEAFDDTLFGKDFLRLTIYLISKVNCVESCSAL